MNVVQVNRPSSCSGRDDLFLGRYDLRRIFPPKVDDFGTTVTFAYGTWEQKARRLTVAWALEERFYEETNAGSAADSNMFGAHLQRVAKSSTFRGALGSDQTSQRSPLAPNG